MQPPGGRKHLLPEHVASSTQGCPVVVQTPVGADARTWHAGIVPVWHAWRKFRTCSTRSVASPSPFKGTPAAASGVVNATTEPWTCTVSAACATGVQLPPLTG